MIYMKPSKKAEIIDFLKSNKDLIHSYGVKKIGLFGSFVRNSQNSTSDIDLLVEFDNDQLNYENYINLAYYIEDSLNTKVDLVTIDSLSPYIGPNILKDVEYVSL
jgi:predicted nucleotidyltransferase